MALSWDPAWPWPLAVFLAAAVFLALLAARGWRDYRAERQLWRDWGGSRVIRTTALTTSLIAVLCWCLASLNPSLTRTLDPHRVHLQVVLDVSESMMRAKGGWPEIKNRVQAYLKAAVTALPREIREAGAAGIVTFRDGTAVALSPSPISELPDAFRRLSPADFAAGSGTHLSEALKRSGQIVERSGGSGALLLISDGNQTEGDGLAAARDLARNGIPVMVLPIESGSPALSVAAADLPRQVQASSETFVRGSVYNGRTQPVSSHLILGRNAGTGETEKQTLRTGPGLSNRRQFSLDPDQWARFRWPLQFEGGGLQFVDLTLDAGDGSPPHQRRFFTQVKRTPRVLSIGGDHGWSDRLPPDFAEVTRVNPESLDFNMPWRTFDVLALSGVPARAVPIAIQDHIANLVTEEGMGLMVFNGDHQGAEPEAETVLMSYNDTSIEPLLPLSSRPRPYEADPPGRQVVILIDTSGSMGGYKLEKTKQITAFIVNDLLRDKDRLDLITFSTGAHHLIVDTNMNNRGKQRALDAIAGLEAGGGTDPTNALALIGGRRMVECGLIFISDGEFAHLKYRPDCRATVFAVGKQNVPSSSPLWQLADPFPVGPSFDPRSIKIPYFQPKKREKFFEEDRFRPLSLAEILPPGQKLLVPELPLNGSAVTYLKKEATLHAVRPKLTDPILAFQDAGAGRVGAFASGFSDAWLADPRGREAVRQWIEYIMPFTARDRYDFKVVDRGGLLELRIELNPRDGILPELDRIQIGLVIPGKPEIDIPLKPDAAAPAAFHGLIQVERDERAHEALLWIKESGLDALPKPQRVPMVIPPAGAPRQSIAAEAFTYGLNRELLAKIAEAGGGIYDPPQGISLFRVKPKRDPYPIWPILVLTGLVSYLTAIGFQRWNP